LHYYCYFRHYFIKELLAIAVIVMRAVITVLTAMLPIMDTATIPSTAMLCITLNARLKVQAITVVIAASRFVFRNILKKLLELQLLDFQLRAFIPFELVAVVVMVNSLDIKDLAFIAVIAIANMFTKLLTSLLADNTHNLLAVVIVITGNMHLLV